MLAKEHPLPNHSLSADRAFRSMRQALGQEIRTGTRRFWRCSLAKGYDIFLFLSMGLGIGVNMPGCLQNVCAHRAKQLVHKSQ